MVFSLVYISKSKLNPFGNSAEAQLRNISERSKVNNNVSGVQGFLYYHDHQFLQILQGDPEKVGMVFEKIKCDPRHSNIQVIWQAKTEKRTFNQWAMLDSMDFAAENYKKLTVEPSIIKRFIPERGHLSLGAFNALVDVSAMIVDDLHSVGDSRFG